MITPDRFWNQSVQDGTGVRVQPNIGGISQLSSDRPNPLKIGKMRFLDGY